jgi:HEAT repeat protein
MRLRHPNIEKLEAQGDIARLGAVAAQDPEWELAYNAAKALGRIGGTQAHQALVLALHSPTSLARLTVLEVLFEEPGKTRADDLAVLLTDSWRDLVENAAVRLVGLGDERGLEALETRALDFSLEFLSLLLDSAQALERRGDPLAVRALRLVLLTRTRHEDAPYMRPDARAKLTLIYEQAADSLATTGSEAAFEALVEALHAPSQKARVAALSAADGLGSPRFIPEFTALLSDDDDRVSARAAFALRQLGAHHTRAVVDSLLVALAEQPNYWGAAGLLATIGGPAAREALAEKSRSNPSLGLMVFPTFGRAAIPNIRRILHDDEYRIRRKAALALQAKGWRPRAKHDLAVFAAVIGDWNRCVELGPSAVPELAAVLRERNDDWPAVVSALARIPSTKATDALVEALDSPGYGIRKAAAEALGTRDDPSAVGPLISKLDDEDWSIRVAAATSLLQLYKKPTLPTTLKSEILALRWTIERPRAERWEQTDDPERNDLIVTGIGVHFPA